MEESTLDELARKEIFKVIINWSLENKEEQDVIKMESKEVKSLQIKS